MKVGVTLVTDSDFFSWASLYRHLTLRTCMTNQTATPPTVMPSVELKDEGKKTNNYYRQ